MGVVIIVFGSVAAVIIVTAMFRHKERMEAIRRGVDHIAFRPIPVPGTGNKALFLGLVVVAIGLALIIGAVAAQRHFDRDMLTGGVILLFTGTAMLVYWKMTASDREQARRMYEKQIETLGVSSPAEVSEKETSSNTGNGV